MSDDRGLFRTLTADEMNEYVRRHDELRAAERERWAKERRKRAKWRRQEHEEAAELERRNMLAAAHRAERQAAWDRVVAKEAAARRRAEKAARDRAEARQMKRAGPARERRSRINWGDLVDERDVVIRQEGWERNTTALAMRAAGLTFAAIGEYMGVTTERARQRVAKVQRVRKRPEHQSPIEHFQRGNVAFQLDQQFSRGELRRLAGSLQAFAWGTQRDWLLVGSQHVGRAP